MRLEQSDSHTIVLVLSKRNVLSLLHKVNEDWSARTIDKWETDDAGQNVLVVVRVEPDADHYLHEDRKPSERGRHGEMVSETEEFIAAYPKECGSTDPGGTCHLHFGHTGNCLMRPDDA